MEKHLMDLQMEKKLVVKEKDGGMIVYPAQFYYMELNTARMLHDLNIRDTVPPEKIRKRLESIVAGEQIELDVPSGGGGHRSGEQRAPYHHRRAGNRKDHHHQHDHPVF